MTELVRGDVRWPRFRKGAAGPECMQNPIALLIFHRRNEKVIVGRGVESIRLTSSLDEPCVVVRKVRTDVRRRRSAGLQHVPEDRDRELRRRRSPDLLWLAPTLIGAPTSRLDLDPTARRTDDRGDGHRQDIPFAKRKR